MKLTPLLPLLLAPVTVLAADQRGDFAMQGIGRVSCEVFLQEREKNSKLYWNIGGWIDGYLTGYNVHVDDTYDITSYAPMDAADSFVILLARHCQNNPDDPVGVIVKALSEQMHETRLQQADKVVQVKVDGRTYALYPTVIARMKGTLKDLGYYDGPVDGGFGPAVESALRRYQEAEKLPVTGAPTQQTLLRILFKQSAGAE